MATDTAVVPRTATPDSTQHLWQVPVFLFAVLVFLAVWLKWLPIGPISPPVAFAQDLDNLRTTYELPSPDRDVLSELLKKIAGNVDRFPDKAQSSHFCLASGYERLAELTPSVDEARGYWMLAQQHFSLVDDSAFVNPDDVKLRYRRSKARAAVGLPDGPFPKEKTGKIRELIGLIDPNNVPIGDDPGEAGRLQADLCLRLTPPDVGLARETLKRYVLSAGLATPIANLDRAKILLGEMCFRLKDMDKSKQALESISPGAPPELIAAARALLGRVRMADGDWRGAAGEWEKVRVMKQSPALYTAATYNLGVCKLRTGDAGEAGKLFEETLQSADCPETVAAAMRLAGLYLNSADPAKHAISADLLVRAMKDVKNPTDLRSNSDITSFAADVVATFELAFKTLSSDGRYEAAIKAVGAYSPISEAGRDKEKRAEILAAWAAALKKEGGSYAAKAGEAAQEYVDFAACQPAVSAKADALIRAAAMFQLAGKPDFAVDVLERASQLPELSDSVAGPVWVCLVDALLEAKRPVEIWPALNKAMQARKSPVSTKIRLDLALHFKNMPQPEFTKLAVMLFEQIAKQSDISTAEQGYQERAMVELASVNVSTGNFATAEYWLSVQLHAYPTGPDAPLARFLLGTSLLQLAAVPSPTGPGAAKAQVMRTEALGLFRGIVKQIDDKPKKDERDTWLRVQASLRILQSHQMMGNANDLLIEAADMRERYQGTVEELIIWSLIYQAFKMKGDRPKALETWHRMKKLYDQLPPSVFTGPGEYSREYWEKVWFPPLQEK